MKLENLDVFEEMSAKEMGKVLGGTTSRRRQSSGKGVMSDGFKYSYDIDTDIYETLCECWVEVEVEWVPNIVVNDSSSYGGSASIYQPYQEQKLYQAL